MQWTNTRTHETNTTNPKRTIPVSKLVFINFSEMNKCASTDIVEKDKAILMAETTHLTSLLWSLTLVSFSKFVTNAANAMMLNAIIANHCVWRPPWSLPSQLLVVGVEDMAIVLFSFFFFDGIETGSVCVSLSLLSLFYVWNPSWYLYWNISLWRLIFSWLSMRTLTTWEPNIYLYLIAECIDIDTVIDFLTWRFFMLRHDTPDILSTTRINVLIRTNTFERKKWLAHCILVSFIYIYKQLADT